MILQALCELAEREGLADDLDFEYRPVSWVICLAQDGKVLGIVGMHQEVKNKRGKVRLTPRLLLVPRFPTGKSGTKAPSAFLVENAKYVFGRPTPDKQFSEEEGREKSGWFREQVDACATATSDAGVVAVSRFLAAHAGGTSLPADVKSNDLFAFALDDASDLVHLRPAVREYWRSRRHPANGAASDRTCVVSGKRVGEPSLFPLVRRVPGGATAGVSFVGFNSPAFESHGWDANENGPVSSDVAEAASTALTRLFTPAYADPRHPPAGTLPKRFISLSRDTTVVFWSSRDGGESFLDSLEGLLAAGSDDAAPVAAVYESVWTGFPPDVEDAGAFYALTVTGVQGRAVLRDWIETSVAVVASNVSRYFRDIAVAREAAGQSGAPVPLRALVASLASPGTRFDPPPAFVADVLHAALRGTPLPVAVLQKALLRARAEAGRDGWEHALRRDARSALIKAVLIRTFRKEVSVSMDPNNTNPGYLMGRLMAVVERMQQAALGDVGATVVDRYFSGASATPAVVFPRLLKNMRNHARKAKDDERAAGTAAWLESETDKIVEHLAGFPPYLDLPQQGFFVLGYHHQRHWLWLPKDQRTTE